MGHARRHFGTLLNFSGLYVLRFPERVKVGHSGELWTRLYGHVRDGALETVLFEVVGASASRRALELRAVAAMSEVGVPIPKKTESFAGLSFDEAVRIVRNLRGHEREIWIPNLPEVRGTLARAS